VAETTEQFSSVETVYAQALLGLADEAGQLEAVAAEMAELGELARGNADLVRLVSTKTLSAGKRADIIKRVFEGRVSDLLYRYLQVVNEKGRLDLLPMICKAFKTLVDRKQGILDVWAYVPQTMSDAQVAQVSQRLGQALSKTVILHQTVDASLIGGLKLRVADQLLDASVATQLRLIRERMVASGRERARNDLPKLLVD